MTSSDQTSNSSNLTFIHQGALGDFLLACPVFDGVYASSPHLRLNFVSRPDHLSLLSEKPYIGFTLSSDSQVLTPFYDEYLWKTAPLPGIFKQTEAIFVFGQTGSRAFRDRLADRADTPVHWIQSFPTSESISLPVSRFLREQVEQCGRHVSDCRTRLSPGKEDLYEARRWITARGIKAEKLIIVHPGSGGRRKIWPLKRWWNLLVWLQKVHGFELLMTLGPADVYLSGFADMAAQKLGVRLLQGLSITRLAAFLSLANLYIGNDSGVSHLAAILGIPVIVFFGPTKPQVWAPNGANVTVVKSKWAEEEILEMPTETSVEEPEQGVCEVLQGILSNDQGSNNAPCG